jgi:hypothetical protein
MIDREKRIIRFVENIAFDYVVKRIKHEYPAVPGGSRYTYYCEACDTGAATEDEIEHYEFCVINQWRELKQELGHADTEG